MEGEDLRYFFLGEFRGEARRLLPVEFPGDGVTHLVGVAITCGDAELDPVLSENFCVGGLVHRPRITQRGVHRIAERLLESAGGELITPGRPGVEFPVRRIERCEAVVTHHLVVELTYAVRPTGVSTERLPSALVMVHHVQVCVKVTSVGVNGNEVVRVMHPFGPLARQFAHALHVIRVVRVELTWWMRPHVVIGLIFPTVNARDLLCRGNEVVGITEGGIDPRRPRRPILTVTLSFITRGPPDRVAD